MESAWQVIAGGPPQSATDCPQNIRNRHVESHSQSFKRPYANRTFSGLKLADMGLAQFRVCGKINLSPSTHKTQRSNLSTEPDRYVRCHLSSIGLFSKKEIGHARTTPEVSL